MVQRLYKFIILHFDINDKCWSERYKPPEGELYTQRQVSNMLINITKKYEVLGNVDFKVLGKGIYKFSNSLNKLEEEETEDVNC